VDLLNINSGNAGLGDGIMTFILNLNSKSDLSPKGLTSLLSFIHDAVNNDSKPFIQKVFKNALKILCSLMRDNQQLSVQEWPPNCGGGNNATCIISTHILRIFNIPFSQSAYDKESEQISVDLAKIDIVHLTLGTLRYLTKTEVPIAVSLISRLVFTAECSKQFA
jgi:hypothetical protein